jgi:hypothetical protein
MPQQVSWNLNDEDLESPQIGVYTLVTSSLRLKMRKFVSLDSSHRFLGNFVSSRTFWEVSSPREGTIHCNWKTCIKKHFLPSSHHGTISLITTSSAALAAADFFAVANPDMNHWLLPQEMFADTRNSCAMRNAAPESLSTCIRLGGREPVRHIEAKVEEVERKHNGKDGRTQREDAVRAHTRTNLLQYTHYTFLWTWNSGS